MNDFILLMWKPFLACLIFTGIHAYLGIHVLERKVVFVDLALAQVAALGASAAFVFGFSLHHPAAYAYSLLATFLGAGVIAFTRSRQEKVPHEAVIGIIYAGSAALTMLILSRVAEGDEHVRHMLLGHILLIDQAELVKLAVLYGVIGFFHWIFRKKMILISTRPEEAYRAGWNVKAWDFIFYLLFGIVVTSSVQIAGVLLVFSFLIIPAVAAMLYSGRFLTRLVLGWGMGLVSSAFGLAFSYLFDFPTGASLVCSFVGGLIIFASIRSLFKN